MGRGKLQERKLEWKLRPVRPRDVELGLGLSITQLLQALFASWLVFLGWFLKPPCPVFFEASGFLVPMARNLIDTPASTRSSSCHGSSN